MAVRHLRGRDLRRRGAGFWLRPAHPLFHHYGLNMQHFTSERYDRASLKALLGALDASRNAGGSAVDVLTAFRVVRSSRRTTRVGTSIARISNRTAPIRRHSAMYRRSQGATWVYRRLPQRIAAAPNRAAQASVAQL